MSHICHFSELFHNEGATCMECSRSRTDERIVERLPGCDEGEYLPDEQLYEICEKLGFNARVKDIKACYRDLRKWNQNHHLNTTLLAAVYYTINHSHYLPVEKILKYSEVFEKDESCKLFETIQNIIRRSDLSFPIPSIRNCVMYTCNQIGISPKYFDKIVQITISIEGEYLSHGRCSPIINTMVATAVYIFSRDFKSQINIRDICNILFVPRPSHRRMLNQLRRWDFVE